MPPTIFAGLTSLIQLNLHGNDLTTLDAGQFTGLPLRIFGLFGNDFTAGTGLPAGIFDGPINIQRTDRPDENIVIGADGELANGFSVDLNVREAHFACSRDDAEDIVARTAGVTDCLLITAAEFATATTLIAADASLSGLILSTGALNPVFDSTITTYTVVVANSIDRVIVTPSATITGATITVNAAAVTSGSDSEAIALPGTPLDIPIVVTAANGNTMMTYTVTVTSAGPLSTATLAGTLTEAGLFATPAPTVTVTLANTEYEAAPGTLLPSHFSVTDTVAGTVSVSDFTRDSDTVATLTLAYSGEDITTAGTLSVTVAAAGHTAAGDLMTNTIAITAAAGAGVNVCGRTAQVRDAIVAASSDAECTSITDLAELFPGLRDNRLELNGAGITSLQPGDFAGLTALVNLRLNDNALMELPADIFAGLTSLQVLRLGNLALEELPATILTA